MPNLQAPIIEKAVNNKRLLKIKKDKLKDLLNPENFDAISKRIISLDNSLRQNNSSVNILFQSAYHGSPHGFNTYYQGEGIENARGFTYERKNFDGTTKDNLIVLLKGKADKSTLLHEFAHVYLTTLNNLARENDKAKDLLIKVNKFLRYNGEAYTTAQHEKFANSFVVLDCCPKCKSNDKM